MPFVCTICNVATKPADCALACCFKSFGLHAACLNAYWLLEQDIKCPNCQAEVPDPIQDMVSTALSRAAQPGKTGAAKVKKTIRKAEKPPAAPKKEKKPKPVPKKLQTQNTTTKQKAEKPKETIKKEGLEGQTFTCPGGTPQCRPSGCRSPWKGKQGKQQYTRHMENKHGWPKSGMQFVLKTSKMYKEGCKYCAKGFRSQRDMDQHLLSDRHKDHRKEQKKNTTTENTTTTVEVEFGAPKPLSQVLPVAQQEGAAEEAAAPAVEEDFKKVRLKFKGAGTLYYYAWHAEEPESEFGAPMLASQVVPVAQQDWPERTAEEEAAWCIEKCIELLENAPPEFSGIQLKLRGMGSWISNYRYKSKEHFSFGKDVLPLEVGSIVDIDKFSDALSDLLYNQPGHRFSGMNCADACIILMSETDPEVLPPDWKAKLSQHDIALRKVIVP